MKTTGNALALSSRNMRERAELPGDERAEAIYKGVQAFPALVFNCNL